MSKTRTIDANKAITIQHSLTNDKGVVLYGASGKPVVYLHGAGALSPGWNWNQIA